MNGFDAARVIADLRELQDLTATEAGADRLCWTDGWQRARDWLRARLAEIPCVVDQDPAGNLWATMEGERSEEIVIGSHIDSVPGGGWLDGALGITAALEVMRARAGRTLPVTLRFVDWADEEGARFGSSLFGSSCAAGRLDVDAIRELRDAEGALLREVLLEHDVDLARANGAQSELERAAAYLELHIEQGPVLEERQAPVAAVSGTYGIRRALARFRGRGGHAGGVPMSMRDDTLIAASKLALSVRSIAEEHGCLGTVGTVNASPSIPTAINFECEVSIDLRALSSEALDRVARESRAAARAAAEEVGVTYEWTELMHLEPVPFDPVLIQLATDAAQAATAARDLGDHRLVVPSGALHDATMVATRVPTVMLFTSSIDGTSHNRDEDTREDHLIAAAEAYDRLVTAVETDLSRPGGHPVRLSNVPAELG